MYEDRYDYVLSESEASAADASDEEEVVIPKLSDAGAPIASGLGSGDREDDDKEAG